MTDESTIILLKFIEVSGNIINKNTSIDNNTIIGNIIEKSLSMFQLMIYNIDSLYINTEDNRIKINTIFLINKKILDIENISIETIIDITIYEIKRDDKGNVIPSTLPKIYNDYLLSNEDQQIDTSYSGYSNNIIYNNSAFNSILHSILIEPTEITNTNYMSYFTNNNYSHTGNLNSQYSITVTPSGNLDVTPTVTSTVTPTVTPTVTSSGNLDVTSNVTSTVTPIVNSNVIPNVTPIVTSNVIPNVIPNVTPIVTSNVIPNVTPTVTNLFNNWMNLITEYTEQEDIKIIISTEELDKLNFMKYNKLKTDIPTGIMTECSICIEELDEDDDILYTKCYHIFHKHCITKWLTEYNNRCPICKKDVACGLPNI